MQAITEMNSKKQIETEEDLPPVNRNTNSSQRSTTTTSFPSPQRPKQHAFRSRKNGRTNQKQSNRNLVIHIGKQVQYAKNSNANNDSSPYNCKVVMSIRAHNTGHSDGTVIEWKPNTVVRMFELIYATKGLPCELHVGFMNDITDKIAETFTSVHQIRQFPGYLENFLLYKRQRIFSTRTGYHCCNSREHERSLIMQAWKRQR